MSVPGREDENKEREKEVAEGCWRVGESGKGQNVEDAEMTNAYQLFNFVWETVTVAGGVYDPLPPAAACWRVIRQHRDQSLITAALSVPPFVYLSMVNGKSHCVYRRE